MDDEVLGAAVRRAERAAGSVSDSQLRSKAFEVILGRLLVVETFGESASHAGRTGATTAAPAARSPLYPMRTEPKTLSQRILALRDDGFFKEPRSIGSIREALGARGWHYPVTTLSGALQGLIQKRRLRRERVREGNKTGWKYSNP
jgi:hypothetical protein